MTMAITCTDSYEDSALCDDSAQKDYDNEYAERKDKKHM